MGMTAYVVKMLTSPTTIFLGFNVRLMDPKLPFKIQFRAYKLMFKITTIY